MKSIKRNLFYNILLNISSVIFPLITAPYVARVLEPDGVGILNFSGTYAGYFALVAMLGIPTYGVREISKIRGDKERLSLLISQLISIVVITTIILSVIYLLSIVFIGQLTENYLIFLLSGFVLYLSPFNVNWFFEGMEEFGFITFRSLVIRIFSIICLFIFVHKKDDLLVMIILNVLGGLIINVWNYIQMRKMGVQPVFTIQGLVPHLKPMSFLFASVVAVSIYTILDTVMLGFMTDYSEVGFYNNAAHISKIITAVVTSLSIVAVPRISYYLEKREYGEISDLLNKSFSFVSFLSIPISVGVICIAPTFIPLFYGVKFLGAIIPLQIMSLIIILIGFNNLAGMQILVGMALDKYFLYSITAGAIGNLIANCLLIPYWGAVGASYASLIAEIIVLIVTSYYVCKYTTVHIKIWGTITKSIIGAITFIPLLLLLQMCLSGWFLIGVFFLLGSSLYLTLELLMKNPSAEFFYLTIIGIFDKWNFRYGKD